MPKTKTQKKIDCDVRLALTDACEQFLEDITGFQWLTHQANYNNFPDSLVITCVFDTDDNRQSGESIEIRKIIQTKLLTIGVKIKATKRQIIFDSEELHL